MDKHNHYALFSRLALLILLATSSHLFYVQDIQHDEVADPMTNVVQLDTGLVAYYQFEGTANDSSGAGNHGVAHNASFVTGKFNQGLQFTGDVTSYVEVPHSASLVTPDAVTISAWAKVASNLTAYSALVYKAGEVPTSSGFQDRVFTLWVRSDGGVHLTSTPEGATSQAICDTGSGSYTYNVFIHFVGVIDTVHHIMSIYVNGSKVAECAYLGNQIRGGAYPMRIGGYFATLGDQSGLTGTLDDVRIYNRALTDAEVAALYSYRP